MINLTFFNLIVTFELIKTIWTKISIALLLLLHPRIKKIYVLILNLILFLLEINLINVKSKLHLLALILILICLRLSMLIGLLNIILLLLKVEQKWKLFFRIFQLKVKVIGELVNILISLFWHYLELPLGRRNFQ